MLTVKQLKSTLYELQSSQSALYKTAEEHGMKMYAYDCTRADFNRAGIVDIFDQIVANSKLYTRVLAAYSHRSA